MIQEERRNTGIQDSVDDDGINKAITMHDALQMHLGDYVSYEDKVNSNSVYAYSLRLIEKTISPKTRKGNFIQFELREKLNRVSASYTVGKEIIENNRVALHSPESIKRYAVSKKASVSDMERISNELKIKEFCHQEVYKDFWEAPNNIVVIWYDDKGQSSFYIVDISNVTLLKKNNQTITELVFVHGDLIISVDNKSRSVKKKGSSDEISTEHHKLGYCPAIQISSLKFGKGNLVTSPMFYSINSFTKLWFWDNTGETSSTFAAHPYIWYLKPDKTPDENNPYAGNGQFEGIGIESTKVENNSSSAKSDLAAGVNVMAVNADKDGKLITPIGRLDADVDSLEFLEKKPMTISQRLIVSLSGVIDSATKSQINETQINAIKEVRNGILNNIARSIERVHRFIEYTVQKEQNSEGFEGVAISYGNKFDILNKGNLLDAVNKSSGNKELQKKAIMDVIDFDTKNNRGLQKTEEVKRLITPFYLTDQSLLDKWLADGTIDYKDWYLGTNLDYLISKYESYNELISNFAWDSFPIENIVNSVKETIEGFIPELKQSNTEETEDK